MEQDVCALCGRTAQDARVHLKELVNKARDMGIESIGQREGLQFKKAMEIYTKEMLYNLESRNFLENLGEEYKNLKISTILDGKDIFKDIYELINTCFIKVNIKNKKITLDSIVQELLDELDGIKPVDKSIELLNKINTKYDMEIDKIDQIDPSKLLTQIGVGGIKTVFTNNTGISSVTEHICITCREIVSKFGPECY